MKPNRMLALMSTALGTVSVYAQGAIDIQPLRSHVEVLRPLNQGKPLTRKIDSAVQPLSPLELSKPILSRPVKRQSTENNKVISSTTDGIYTKKNTGLPKAVKSAKGAHSSEPINGLARKPRTAPTSDKLNTDLQQSPSTIETLTNEPTTATPSGERPLAQQQQTKRDSRLKAYEDDIARAKKAVAEGQNAEALAILLARWDEMIEYEDAGSLGYLAYLLSETGNEEPAIRAAHKAAELADEDEFYLALANILIRFGRLNETEEVLSKMDPNSSEAKVLRANLAANRAKILYEKSDFSTTEAVLEKERALLEGGTIELLGWTKYRLEKFDEAAQTFFEAYQKTHSPSSAQGIVFSLHHVRQYDRLLAWLDGDDGPLSRLVPTEVRKAIAHGHPRLTTRADGQLTIAADAPVPDDAQPTSQVRLETVVRSKGGTAGEGRLHQTIPATTLMWHGDRSRLSLRIEGHEAHDGVVGTSGSGFYALWQRDIGEGWSTRFGLGRLSAAPIRGLGVSQPWIGELGTYYHGSDWGIGLAITRRPVQDSLLSLSGKPAMGTDPAWGQVIQTGLTISGNHKVRDWAITLSFTLANLEGTRVAKNVKSEFYGRALKAIPGWDDLKMGPEAIIASHQHNLSAYQPGHGGYFSPRIFAQIGWLVVYKRAWLGIDWNLESSLGYGWNRQSAAASNPLTGAGPGVIAPTSGQGLAYRLFVDASRPLNRQWKLGVWTEVQRSANYHDWRVGVYTSGAIH